MVCHASRYRPFHTKPGHFCGRRQMRSIANSLKRELRQKPIEYCRCIVIGDSSLNAAWREAIGHVVEEAAWCKYQRGPHDT